MEYMYTHAVRQRICVYGRTLIAPAKFIFVYLRLSPSILPSLSVFPMHVCIAM